MTRPLIRVLLFVFCVATTLYVWAEEPTPSPSVDPAIETPVASDADAADEDADEEEEEIADADDMEIKENPKDVRPWQAPSYTGQTEALGYSEGAFAIPAGFEDRVQFWTDIYTKYTTTQGVIHDTKYLNVVYESVDLNATQAVSGMNERSKRRAKKDFLKTQKNQIAERLRRLATLKSSEGLEGDDLKYWQMFEKIADKNKFRDAAQNGRIRFQLGQADRFKQGIYYSGRYLRQMEQIFREEGLPIELTRLPFVESSFNIFARSKVGASGIWQFMRGTARLFKLKMTPATDDRNDPLIATRAAARLLKSNFQMLNSWPLALTAYNHGPAGVSRIVRKIGSNDIAQIVEKATGRRFGFASENFYACFLAALGVEREAARHFGDVHWSGELQFAEIELAKPIRYESLISQFEGEEMAETFNPHLTVRKRRAKSILPKNTLVRVPAAKRGDFESAVQGSSEVAEVKRVGKASAGQDTYRVRRGDTLGAIARQFGVKVDDLMDANDLRSTRAIRAGQILRLPD